MEEIMKKNRRYLYLLLGSILIICCSDKDREGIVPSSHTIDLFKDSKVNTSTRDRYNKFDRKTILNIVTNDDRYTSAIESAKNSVEPLIRMSDEELRALIPPAHTKRAMMVHRSGCPVHGGGTAVYQPFGIKANLNYPLKVHCPIGGEEYPNSDFPDDGQGWLDNRAGSPTEGERYYFIGWFNHWFLNQMPTYFKTMAHLWFLTGEQVYRDKACVILERFMEVYPDIDGKDLTYDGTDWGVYVKMTGTYWEGTVLMNLASGIELFLPTFDDGFIEEINEKIYRPAYEAYHAKPASGNWGNLWNTALTKIGTVIGNREMLEFVLYDHPAAEVPTLDNQFMRDGFPFEASISYASTYQFVASNVADAMGDNGRWVWEHPHLRESFHAFADLVCLGRFTHFAADAGSIHNNGWTLPVAQVRAAYCAYRTPKLARYLLQAIDVQGLSDTVTLDDLFREPLDMNEVRQKAASAGPEKSTLAPLRGFAILRTGEDDNRTSLFLDYGFSHRAHSHADRLNINLFAAGREFIPEMGYPEYMDHKAPATGGWTTHTVCHATVEVDEKRQLFSTFGDLHGFVEADGIRYVDASCEDAYAHCGVDLYRRTLALIDIPGGAYAVDLFRVRGGNRHDYHFHGPPAGIEIDRSVFSGPTRGTLAGEDVEFGFKPEGVTPYGIDNSGYQYLFDVRETFLPLNDSTKPFDIRWSMDDGVAFAVSFVPDGSETLFLAQGYPRPESKSLPAMPFLVRRKDTGAGGDISNFASVLSVEKPGTEKPLITDVRRIELSSESDPSAYGLVITHVYGKDLVLSTTSVDGAALSADGRYRLKGQFGTASWRNGGLEKVTLIGASEMTVDDRSVYNDTPVFDAAIRQVYDDKIVLDRPMHENFSGQILLVDRHPVRSAYRIERNGGETVHVHPTTWIGRGRVGKLDEETGELIDGRSIFRLADIERQPHADKIRNYYSGAWITTEDGSACYRIKTADDSGVVLDTSQDLRSLSKDFPQGSTFLIYDIGPGDRVRILARRQGVF